MSSWNPSSRRGSSPVARALAWLTLAAILVLVSLPVLAAQDGTLTRVALARGGTLLVLEDRRAPLVTVSFGVPRGRVLRGWDTEDEGAWHYQTLDSRIDVWERLSLLPADLALDVGRDEVTLWATCLAKDIEALASLLAVVLNSDFRGLPPDLT